MNHQDGASPISSGTGSATSQPITSSRLRPTRSASPPAARFVSAFAAPKATTKARIAARRVEPEVLLADERQHAALEPDHRADERVQRDEQAELARVRAQPEPNVGHALDCGPAGAVGGDDRRLTGGGGRHVGEQRLARSCPTSVSASAWLCVRSNPIEENGLPERARPQTEPP